MLSSTLWSLSIKAHCNFKCPLSSKTATADISFLLHPGSMLHENRARGFAWDMLAACRGKGGSGLNKDLKQNPYKQKPLVLCSEQRLKWSQSTLLLHGKYRFLKILKVVFVITYTRQPALSSRYNGWGKKPSKETVKHISGVQGWPCSSLLDQVCFLPCHLW